MTQQNVRSKFDPTSRPTAVIGAGTLGMRVALMFASSGGEVRLFDAKPAQLDVAEAYINAEMPKFVKAHRGAVAGHVAYVKSLEAAIADTWPAEPAPDGSYPRHLTPLVKGSFESIELGTVLNRIDLAIRRLTPEDPFHASIATSLRSRMVDLREQRRALIENGQPSLSWPFMAILMFWLAVIFAVAGLTSPRNLLVLVVACLAALSLGSSIFLALSLDAPLTGLIKVSSAPMHDALLHITQPPLPAAVP